ncbi:cytochrome c-type biogenesis protein CcmH [Salipaludibacillus keqinensis]|uniref:Cytochrome c-type biogenesis protein n=1 Tax=Salipaludibacillus keqinensis TaxID=2045207 RepID=A0A323TFY6_9BACI|nr:cytochrome c-type biogenesis protein [Salipaludibacillus keqinensis]PYZ93400.1 cytochrome c-type biogenesis protein CcmH [Salipaludibacillus keqinensis]
MIGRLLIIMVLMLIVTVPAMAQGNYDRNSPEFRENTSQFMCLCGCGQDHFECNMEGCGLNEQFKTEILEMMNEDGYDKNDIKEHYVSMYGEVILTAPEKSGFSLTAWVTPFVLLAGAGGGIIYLIRKWVRKSKQLMKPDPTDELEDETEREILHSLIDEERKKHF